MIWVDVAVRTAALASAIIATLRAGSRAAYLLEHDAIGIMEGPTIQRTANESSYPLFELSEAFRHCVRLSVAPAYYENVQRKRPVITVVEPYLMSPKPYLPRATTKQPKISTDETTTTMTTVGKMLEAKESALVPSIEDDSIKEAIPSFWSRQYSAFARALSNVPSSVNYTGKYLAMTPQIVSYWTERIWNWKREEAEESDLEEDGK